MFILYLNRILHRLLLLSSFLLLILILHIHHGAVIMPVLLTGGTGKTSVRLARFLQNENIPFLLASRRGLSAAPSGMPAVQFDWLDQSTWKEPFQHRFAGGGTISAIYLMEPLVAEPWKPMKRVHRLCAQGTWGEPVCAGDGQLRGAVAAGHGDGVAAFPGHRSRLLRASTQLVHGCVYLLTENPPLYSVL